MDPSWIDLVTKVGFPIVVALLVGRWAAQRVEAAETRGIEREKTLSDRLHNLEGEVRDDLKALVREGTSAVLDSKAALRECTQMLRDIAPILSKLKQSSPTINLPPGTTEMHIDASGSGVIAKGRTEK